MPNKNQVNKVVRYVFQIKKNDITNKCKIVRLELNYLGAVLKKTTRYKNLTPEKAEEVKYFLERGREPLI